MTKIINKTSELDFIGIITVSPPLSQEEVTYLKKFSRTRRMNSTKGPYYVDNPGYLGQAHTEDVIDYNNPPAGQPSLWCHWEPTEDGEAIQWNWCEKFYAADEWMQYLINHFIGPNPLATSEFPFLTGHTLNGEIEVRGRFRKHWNLVVKNSVVSIEPYEIEDQLGKIEAAYNATTQGIWEVCNNKVVLANHSTPSAIVESQAYDPKSNLEFIVCVHKEMPALIAEIRELLSILNAYKMIISAHNTEIIMRDAKTYDFLKTHPEHSEYLKIDERFKQNVLKAKNVALNLELKRWKNKY